MASVVRYVLPTAESFYIDGVGQFIDGVLDVDANNLLMVARARYLIQPYRAVELGIVDSEDPKPTLPGPILPPPPNTDPYPQYLTQAESDARYLTEAAALPVIEGVVEAAFADTGLTTVSVDGVPQGTLDIESTPVTGADFGVVGPAVLVPPSTLYTAAAATTWATANNANFQRFTVPVTRVYRYLNVGITVASGNVEVGIVALSGTGLRNYTRVVTTGIIPATVTDRFDVGPVTLPGGDYALYVWSDNTTLQTRVGTNSAVSVSRLATEHGSYPTGIPATGAVSNWTGSRYIAGCSIEADV